MFYPLAAVLAAVMVWLALLEDAGELPSGSVSGADTDYRVIRVYGPDLNRFQPTPALSKQLVQDRAGLILRLQPSGNNFPDAPEAGPHFRLAPDLATAFAGRTVRVNVRARRTGDDGASALEVSYSLGPQARSRWQRFDLSEKFANYQFDYAVPQTDEDFGVDYVGIRPVVAADAGSIEIESLTLVNLTLWR
ncbi:MAG: hypothetical protein AAGJ29_07685 [Pseudomonadota bacterium]